MKYFQQEECKKTNDEFTEEECIAFFAHCVYYIQIRNQHQKTERMREVTGLAGILTMAFFALLISDVIISIILGVVSIISIILFFIYAICLIVLLHRYKRAMKNRVKMVLAIYDVCVGKEEHEGGVIF